ncbi:hypothetical protein GENT5_01250 [Flavobacterium ammoniigenes]|uniref:Uncharacterized protein n=1 Tax=Flavobacterium ammoniigenes TaxID=1751095 RepID=A0ABN6KX78_9FLAO|nr:hypothetical protein GENT5_01250 [Flavobacterium ammoniigenes]
MYNFVQFAKARVKISDTKICPHCAVPTLIYKGFAANQKQQFFVKCERNGVLIFIQVRVVVKKSIPIS